MRKLSLILTLALVLTTCFGAFDTSFASSANDVQRSAMADEFMAYFDISNPTLGKADDYKITRAEALSVFASLLGYEGSGDAQVPFTDVKADLKGELRYALDLKMISESDTFRPNEPITYNEAFKMCTVALGYDYLAKAYGGWPAGYIRIANDINLATSLPTNEVTISALAFTNFVENFLTAEMLEVEGMVGDEIEYRKYTTVLYTYFNLYEIEGIVTANEYTGLYSADDATDEGSIAIDDKEYVYAGESNNIGRHVKAYADAKSNKIAFVVPFENDSKTISFTDFISADGTTVKYDENGTEKKIKLDSVPAMIYNGKADGNAKVSDFADKNGYFTFVDNDGDKVYEICEISDQKTVLVAGVNAVEGYINDKNGERKIDLSNDDCKYFIYENGKEITLADISAGNLITYCASKDGLVIVINLETQTISGVVTGFQSNAIVVDDVKYNYSDYFEKYYLSKIQSGKTLTFMLSSQGLIEASSEPEKDVIKFGYYLDCGKGKGLDTKISVKFVAQDGAIAVVEVDDKFTLNGTSYNKADDIASIFFDSNGNKKLGEQVIRYKLSAEGKFRLMDTVTEEEGYVSSNDDFEDNLKKYAYPSSGDLVHDGIWLEKNTNIVHPWYAITSETFIIQVNSDTTADEDKRFAVRDIAWFKANNNFPRKKTSVYNVDEYLCAGAIIFDTVAEDKVTDESPLGIVHSVTKALDPERNECYKLVVFRNNYYYDLYISDNDLVNKLLFDEAGNMKVSAGDCVRYEANSQNYIAALEVDYDFSADKLLHKNSNQMYLCYYYGGVYSMGNGIVTMVRAKDDGTLDIDHQKYAFKNPGTVTIYDSKSGEIMTGSTDEFETYLQVGDDCTRIMFVTDSMQNRLCVIYR